MVAETQGIAALGIDGKALLFQLANFLILLGILRFFAYPRIVKILEERRQKIEESLLTAQQLSKAKGELLKKEQEILFGARKQADGIVSSAQEQGRHIIVEAESKARMRAQQIKKQGEQEIEQSVRIARQDLKKEALGLVALATKTVIGQKLDEAGDEALIKEALEEASQALQQK